MANTIYIGPAEQQPDVLERVASEQILPGQIMVEVDGSFELVNGTQTGIVYVALENILEDTPDAYEIGDSVQAARVKPGQYYQSVLAANQSVSRGDGLTTDDSGNLVLAAFGEDSICSSEQSKTTGEDAGFITVYFSKNFIQGAVASWYNKTTGMVSSVDSLIQCNEDLIQCL